LYKRPPRAEAPIYPVSNGKVNWIQSLQIRFWAGSFLRSDLGRHLPLGPQAQRARRPAGVLL